MMKLVWLILQVHLKSLKIYQNVFFIDIFNLKFCNINWTQNKCFFWMKIVKTDKCLYCEDILDSTFHAVIEYP